MNAFVRRFVAATLPVLSAVTLFAGSAPAHADLTLPPVGDDRIELCVRNGGTPEQCAALQNPTHVPQGALNPSTTAVRRVTTVRENATASSSGAVRIPAQLIRSR